MVEPCSSGPHRLFVRFGMAETEIGEFRVQNEQGELTITHKDRSDVSVYFNADGVETLIEFLTVQPEPQTNRRRTFRVSLWDSSGLTVVVHCGGHDVETMPRSIGLTGVLVELPDSPAIELPVGTQAEVTLSLDGTHEKLDAIVRRREGRGCGLFFPASMKDDDVDPPESHVRMVMEMQRRWLVGRKR